MSSTHPAMKRKQDLKVAGNVYIQGNAAWHAGNLSKSEFAPSSHVGAGGSAHAVATPTTAGFLSASDKAKLDGIQANAINQTTADGRYLQLTGGTLTGNLTIQSVQDAKLILDADTDNDAGETGIPQIIMKTDGGTIGGEIYLSQSGVNNGTLVIAPFTNYNTTPVKNYNVYIHDKKIWHEGNFDPSTKSDTGHTHTTAQITDLTTKYYSKTEIDGLLAPKGDVKSNASNTFTLTNTFSYAGVAVRIQPSRTVGGGAILFQINNSAGNSLITMGTWDTDETKGKIVINGDLEVTGTTIQRATQEIEGDMNVTGNLNVTGNAILGESLADQTTVKGDLRLEGEFKPVGKYLEVARFPVYGIGGDLQFQTDSLSFEDIIHHYSTFDVGGGSCIPPAGAGATRYYKILIVYSSTGTDTSTFRIIQKGTANEICSFVLPSVNGGTDSTARTWMSAPFTTSYTGHTTFQAKKDVSGELAIRYIEVIAYDYYA